MMHFSRNSTFPVLFRTSSRSFPKRFPQNSSAGIYVYFNDLIRVDIPEGATYCSSFY
jgi:hypothetical protein